MLKRLLLIATSFCFGLLLLRPVRVAPDFTNIWAGAKLATSRDLYQPAAIVQAAKPERAWCYNRLPFYAVFLAPLGSLNYAQALRLWLGLQIGALSLCVWLLTKRLALGLALVVLYVPTTLSLVSGQDVPLVLLALALGHKLSQSSPVLSGLAFSLCAIKPHLVSMLPLGMIAAALWRVLGGFVIGVSGLALVSFVAQGLDWPIRYIGVLSYSEEFARGHQTYVPTLYGVVHKLPAAPFWWAAGSIIVAVATWRLCRRSGNLAMPVATAASFVVAPHAYLYDLALLLYPALALLDSRAGEAVRLLAWTSMSGALVAAVAWPSQLTMVGVLVYSGWLRHRAEGRSDSG